MKSDFEPFGLMPQLVQAVADLGYTNPTPIQSGIIPHILAGRDVIGQAQTGTGKTAAFALPLLQNLAPDAGFTQALVIAPTRELALQVAKAIQDYGRNLPVRVLTVYGGRPYGPQIKQLRRGVDIVVGTPGRMLDLLNKRALDLSGVHMVVLDEADEMLNMGFIEDIEAILAAVPETRQTALFSATMPPRIRKLADRYLHNPESITIRAETRTVEAIEQRHYQVRQKDKAAALARLFEMETIESALVFASTREGTVRLARDLAERGYPAEPLNGELSQEARERVLGKFRKHQIKVVVATDVAARGLDIDHISHVFNYDLPQDTEGYIHRVGRTGRAGKDGVAISLVTPRETHKLKRIERLIRRQIPAAQLPTIEAIQEKREAMLVERLTVWIKRGRAKKERRIVERLIAEGVDPLDIAAASLKMARKRDKTKPIEAINTPSHYLGNHQRRKERDSKKRAGKGKPLGSKRFKTRHSHEQGMTRLIFKAGRSHNIRPADVVAVIAHNADIPGGSIGAIKIQDHQTIVDIQEEFVAKVLSKNGRYNVRRRDIQIERA